MVSLEARVKTIARENGAVLVGIASRERLVDAPPSADPGYLLSSTRSIISLGIPLDRDIIRDYLRKKEWLAFGADLKRVYRQLYVISDCLADYLRERGFETRVVDCNQSYRPEPNGTDAVNRIAYVPDFSHRYGAVAAGLGWLGWSGNLLTPQHGATVLLGSVLTSARLEADPPLDQHEDRCHNCKVCVFVCPVRFMSSKEAISVTIARREHAYAKRIIPRCIIGCNGYHGLGENKKWSTWSPYRLNPFPEDEGELATLSQRVRAVDPLKQGNRSHYTERDWCFNPNEIYFDTCANCQITCWEDLEDRKENRRLLFSSGTVALTAEAQRVTVPAEETTELHTPFEVRVAVSHPETQTSPSRKSGSTAQSPMDVHVMSLLRDQRL